MRESRRQGFYSPTQIHELGLHGTLAAGRPLVLGGVEIPFDRGLEGHSDGDVLLHAVPQPLVALTGLRKAVTLAGIFFFAGALAWLVVQILLALLATAPLPTWTEIATNIAISGLLAILFGTGFYFYEVMRQRLLDSTSRLKEAEFAEKELALARSIQERLLPPTELSGEGYRIAARHLPARYVAGDFFDFFSLRDGALGLVVADVAGKGVGASLVMASVKAALPLLAAGRTVEETLVALNEKLCDELDRRQFVGHLCGSSPPIPR